MKIKITSSTFANGGRHLPEGATVDLPAADAYELVHAGRARPANKAAIDELQAMTAKARQQFEARQRAEARLK